MMPGLVLVQVGLLLVMPSAAPRNNADAQRTKIQLSRQIGSWAARTAPKADGDQIAQRAEKTFRRGARRRLIERLATSRTDSGPADGDGKAAGKAGFGGTRGPRRNRQQRLLPHGQPPAGPARPPAKNHPVIRRLPKGMAVANRPARKIRERRGADYVPMATPCQGRVCHCATAVSAVAYWGAARLTQPWHAAIIKASQAMNEHNLGKCHEPISHRTRYDGRGPPARRRLLRRPNPAGRGELSHFRPDHAAGTRSMPSAW